MKGNLIENILLILSLRRCIHAVVIFTTVSVLLLPAVGYSDPRVRIPIRWCVLVDINKNGGPTIDNPELAEPELEGIKGVLWVLHERPEDDIYAPQADIGFRSGATREQPRFPFVEDTTTTGDPGDVIIPCKRDGSDCDGKMGDGGREFNAIIRRCRQLWEAGDPKVVGITAVQINQFVEFDNARGGENSISDFIGFGGVSADTVGSARIMVIDRGYTSPVSGKRRLSDPQGELVGHEFGHALTLDHGNGRDDPPMGILPDGIIDNDPEEDISPPLNESGDINLMEYLIPNTRFDPDDLRTREGTQLTILQVDKMRKFLKTKCVIPDVENLETECEDPLGPEKLVFSKSRVEDVGDANLNLADIAEIGVTVSQSVRETRLFAGFDESPSDRPFDILFFVDTDNDPTTGGNASTFLFSGSTALSGIEVVARTSVSGTSTSNTSVFRFNTLTDQFDEVLDPNINAEVMTEDVLVGDDFMSEPVTLIKGFAVQVTVPSIKIDQLGREIVLDVRTLTFVTNGTVAVPLDDARLALTFEPPTFPSCQVDPEQAARGDTVTVEVLGLPANVPVLTRLGTEEVATGFTDSEGNTALEFRVPLDTITGPRKVSVGVVDPPEIAMTADCELTLTVPPPVPVSKCYFGKQIPPFTDNNPQLPFPTIASVTLNDQFASRETDVRFLQGLCNPAGKNTPVNSELKDHLSCYSISDAPGQALFIPGLIGEIQIETENFGEDTVKLGHALELCVSARKNGEFADIGDFKCYSARNTQRDFPEITLDDQFFSNKSTFIERLSRFCTPVGKNQPAPPENPEAYDHLACYDIGRDRLQPQIGVNLTDQFIEGAVGQDITFTAEFERRFCEPARKISVQQ